MYVAIILALAFFAVFAFVAVTYERREIPEFIELEKYPDPALKGTVAYVDPTSGCVNIVPLGGGASVQVHWLRWFENEEPEIKKKPIGPQLVWLPDGRLEVTMFLVDMSQERTDSPDDFSAGWQTIVDVRSRLYTDTPESEVPSQPNVSARPTTSPTGEVLSYTSNEKDGHITIALTDAKGAKRILLDEHGPRNRNYRLKAVFWSPDFQSVIADDGRILVINPTEPAVTRVLVTVEAGNPFGIQDDRLSGFAVTSEEITLDS